MLTFDVLGTELRSSCWVDLEVHREGKDVLRVSAPLSPGMHEDSIAAHLADELADALNSEVGKAVHVVEVDGGPDRIACHDALLQATVRSEKGSWPRLAVTTSVARKKGEPSLSGAILDLPAKGVGSLMLVEVDGVDSNGKAVHTSAAILIAEGESIGRSTIAKALSAKSIPAEATETGVRVSIRGQDSVLHAVTVTVEPLLNRELGDAYGVALTPEK